MFSIKKPEKVAWPLELPILKFSFQIFLSHRLFYRYKAN